MKQWFVVHTQPGKESTALKHLCDQGFDAYLPQFKKTRRHARKVDEVLAPLFPRYLFVGLDLDAERWRSINGTRGVAYILLQDDRPAMIRDEIIQHLKSQETEEGLVPVTALSLFSTGETVRVTEGAFEGHLAIFQKLDEKARVELFLSFMGKEQRLVVPLSSIQSV